MRVRRERRRWRLALASLVGVLMLSPAPAHAAVAPSDLQPCQTPAPPAGTAPQADSALAQLQDLIDNVPCATSGQISYDTADNLGGGMDVLDPIADPTGGYLGVYHTAFGPYPWQFRISLAQSADLIHWTRIVVLDPLGASMPTLRAVPGTSGFLLAYEKKIPHVGDVVRLRYYASLSQLETGHFAAQRDLPQTFSRFNDGTPTILSITWHHALARSVIHIGFHYETEARGARGPDREAIGTLVDFRRWTAHTESPLDAALDRQGLSGSHGDWRQFSFAGDRWRIYEGQTTWDDFGSWRVVLQDTSTGQLYPLTLSSDAQAVSGSVANPVVAVLPAPDGAGQVLVVTLYLFSADPPAVPGELVYYQTL
ncbi:MAG TPA: hypothetical protein VMA77_15510 [Solirubrobacteraceae bacterium]|nr:hypothetical protein [Solirubrobacteraceae bacterium]